MPPVVRHIRDASLSKDRRGVLGRGVTPDRIAPPTAMPPRFQRDPTTLACYAFLALLTSSYGMIGPLMPSLRAALDLSYQEGAYHTSAMSVGTVVTGLLGPAIRQRIGRRGCIMLTLALMAAGGILLCSALHLAMSLTAGLFFGASIALAILVCPAVFAERHGALVGIANAEGNFLAYLGIFLMPGVVSLSTGLIGWRWSFVLPVLAYGLYWALARRIDFGQAVERGPVVAGRHRLPFGYWCYWAFLAFSVACEFAMVVWGASYLETVSGLPRDRALLASMIFPAGMLLGRFAGTVLMRRFTAAQQVLPIVLLNGLGVWLFLSSSQPTLGMIGLFLSGIGMANLYPLGITLALLAAGPARDAASARASLASGVASLAAPLVIGTVADRAGLATGFMTIFIFIAGIAISALLGGWSRRAAG